MNLCSVSGSCSHENGLYRNKNMVTALMVSMVTDSRTRDFQHTGLIWALMRR